MIEKIKSLNFYNLTKEESENVLVDILSLDDDKIEECINVIIDNINLNDIELDNADNLHESFKIILDDDKIKQVMENIIKKLDDEIE